MEKGLHRTRYCYVLFPHQRWNPSPSSTAAWERYDEEAGLFPQKQDDRWLYHFGQGECADTFTDSWAQKAKGQGMWKLFLSIKNKLSD